MNRVISFKAKMLSVFLKNFSLNMNVFSLKKPVDFLFVFVEKIVIKLDKFLMLYIQYYADIIDAEIDLANISNDDKVLHIGCGSVPSTSILVSQKTGSKVTTIDKNNHSVKEANLCINSVNLKDKVKVEYADALNFSVEGFDVVIISQGTKPRDGILEHVSKSMKTDARIVFRAISSPEGNLTEYDMDLKKRFKIIKNVSHPQHGLLISVLLLKK